MKNEGIPDGQSAEPISIKSLKSSDRIVETLKRKPEKYNGTITYEPLKNFQDCKEDLSVKPAILLTAIHPDFSARPPDQPKGGEVKIKIMLRGNGQVGDIIVYSDADRRILKTYAESASKAKFIAAESNGKPVDACEIVWSQFGVEVSHRVFTVSK